MESLLTQIQKGEGQTIEFKASFQKEVIETVVAFANAKGGKIFVGVNDNAEILGVKLGQESLQHWLNQIKQNTSPSIIPDIDTDEINHKTIVIIDVKEYPIKPINYKHKYLKRKINANHLLRNVHGISSTTGVGFLFVFKAYQRAHSKLRNCWYNAEDGQKDKLVDEVISCTFLSMEEIANEYLKTKNSSWDYYIDNTQNFNNLSLEKLERFIQKIEINQGKKFTDSPMQIMHKYGLSQDDKITFAAYLLFIKDFCIISGIQVGRFKTSIDIIDSLSLNTDLITEIDELMIFIQKHLMVEFIITGNPQREQPYDYPIEAIREIVLNMIVHRDYRDSSDSVIKIFDDRIEFFNPGELYDHQTIEQLNNNQYRSKTRNKLIALMFKECGLIEKYGSGITRIKNLCLDHKIPEPKFEALHKGFKVTLYKETTQEKHPPTKQKICELIEQNNNITRRELSNKTGVSENAIKQQLAKLKIEGVIRREGSTKAGYWKIIK